MLIRFLHALGIRDRAGDDHLVIGLGAVIIFGLLAILVLKIMLMRAQRLAPEHGLPRPRRTLAVKAWFVARAVAGILVMFAVAILAALRLNS